MKPATKKSLAIGLGVIVLLELIASPVPPNLIDSDCYHDGIVLELEKIAGGSLPIGEVS
jgi:hypothetical protein